MGQGRPPVMDRLRRGVAFLGLKLRLRLDYVWHRSALCPFGRHYRKFGTYPQRLQCIYCHDPPPRWSREE